MPLVAVKTAGRGLVAMPGLGIDGRDDAILRDTPRDPKHAVGTLVEILARDRGQQRRGLPDGVGELAAIQRPQQRAGILGERVDQRRPGIRVVVVADMPADR